MKVVKKVGRLALIGASLAVGIAALAQEIQTPAGMRKEAIDDPTLSVKAFDVYVPAKWHFAGRMIQGTSCSAIAFPVFRATSPDGLTILERLPRVDWKWGSGPNAAGDCLPLKRELSAKEFLKYMAATFQVQYVADDPYPADVVAQNNRGFEDAKAANAAKYRAAGMIPPEEHTDMDRAIVSYKNGSFTIKGQIAASIYCSTNTVHANPNQPAWVTHSCTATMRYVRAPEAQYAAAMKLLERAGAVQNPQWAQAWSQRNNAQTQQGLNRINQQAAQTQAQLNASHQQFMQSQATRQKMHEEFMATMQRGTDMSMNRTAQAMNARSTATSNWVDYALDQQTVRDPNSGQVNKVSSTYSYTWVDSTGKTSYQTNDANANPNGALNGNWTRQQVVNGDGTPH
jgi:hypothetical protein